MSAFLTGLESCGWLKHIKAVMDTSVFIAKVGIIWLYIKLSELVVENDKESLTRSTN